MPTADNSTMRINLKRMVDESYDVVFGLGLFPQIARDLKAQALGSRYAIITDSNVNELYGGKLKGALETEGLQTAVFSFGAGEQSKNLDVCKGVMGRMSKSGYGRDSVVIALGGGVVGDLAGLIAALFNRGIPYVQVPTTLLAMADSAIGGKTAVDTEDGKNLVGVFKQPARVYADISTLETLAERDFRSGLAETVKNAIIQDAGFFGYLQQNTDLILRRDPAALLHLAKQNCSIKGNIVEQDPHEKGLRRILNYGHTVGHAVEMLSGFGLSHGESVAIGMMAAGRIAIALGYFSLAELEQQAQLLLRFGLPIRIPVEISGESIINATAVDKKAAGGFVRYVLPASIGRINDFGGVYATPVKETVVMSALRETR